MARIDTSDTWWRARPSALHYWWCWLAAATLAASGWTLQQPTWFGPGYAKAGVWLLFGGASLGVWTGVVILCGGRSWMTSRRVVQSRGVVSRHTSELSVVRLQQVDVRQNAVERALGIGRVLLRSGDEGTRQITLPGVRDPENVAEAIRDAREDAVDSAHAAGSEDDKPPAR